MFSLRFGTVCVVFADDEDVVAAVDDVTPVDDDKLAVEVIVSACEAGLGEDTTAVDDITDVGTGV